MPVTVVVVVVFGGLVSVMLYVVRFVFDGSYVYGTKEKEEIINCILKKTSSHILMFRLTTTDD